MRGLRIEGCLLVAGSLFSLIGCGQQAYKVKGAEKQATQVTINNCVADPDGVRVHRGDNLTWQQDPSDHNQYKIKFPNAKPISSSTPPLGQGQNVTGDFACNNGSWINPHWCEYAYDLVQNGTKCPDPGVHVVPGP